MSRPAWPRAAEVLYAAYVHLGDLQHAHSVTIPDFPGCFSGADDWRDLPAKVQEAVEVYCDSEDLIVPTPTPLETLARRHAYRGGVWMMVDIDLKRIQARTVRITIALSESLLQQIDQQAGQLSLSRSAFLAKAAKRALRE